MPASDVSTRSQDIGGDPQISQPYFSLHDLRLLLLFSVGYFIACGYGFLFGTDTAAPLWFPDSVLLCALLLAPFQKWWLYLVVAISIRFCPGLHPSMPLWVLLGTSGNDVLKGALSAYLLRRIVRGPFNVDNLRIIAPYLGISVFLVPMLSAFGGAAVRHAQGFPFWPSWSEWFMGDALANVVLTPALLYWLSGYYRELRPRAIELLLWSCGFAICLHYTFSHTYSDFLPVALYIPVPFLIWAATRFGPIGASSALSLVALASIVGIAGRNGAFSAGAQPEHLLFVQLFLAVVSVPVLFVAILTKERSDVELHLRESQEKLSENYDRVRDLGAKLIQAQEHERKRIALELHDDISQRLSILSAGLDEFGMQLPPQMTEERVQLSSLKQGSDDAADAIRRLSHELHSSALHYLGLTKGLRALCRTISERHHIAVDLRSDEISDISYDLGLCLFRVAQEAINNVVKHSGATEVEVLLLRSPGSIRLVIKDKGIGFNGTLRSNGLGLVGMQERLRIVGGTFTLTSTPGHGTTIEAVVRPPAAMRAGAD
jgi:signal transduction histidine kinase